jgi:hypothetical protein
VGGGLFGGLFPMLVGGRVGVGSLVFCLGRMGNCVESVGWSVGVWLCCSHGLGIGLDMVGRDM